MGLFWGDNKLAEVDGKVKIDGFLPDAIHGNGIVQPGAVHGHAMVQPDAVHGNGIVQPGAVRLNGIMPDAIKGNGIFQPGAFRVDMDFGALPLLAALILDGYSVTVKLHIDLDEQALPCGGTSIGVIADQLTEVVRMLCLSVLNEPINFLGLFELRFDNLKLADLDDNERRGDFFDLSMSDLFPHTDPEQSWAANMFYRGKRDKQGFPMVHSDVPKANSYSWVSIDFKAPVHFKEIAFRARPGQERRVEGMIVILFLEDGSTISKVVGEPNEKRVAAVTF
ncbi:hypothetical protein HDU78_001247 [Chytriomyces hyalinus]|nr:hypothetical protein HDU78_001247 [Chytriomyces hyalinus]